MRATSVQIILILLTALPGCLHTRNVARKMTISKSVKDKVISTANDIQQAPQIKRPTITIWIHGTRFFPAWCFKNLYYCQPGLTLAKDLDKKYYMRGQVDALAQTDPEQYPLESFYLYGWSGAVNFKTRKQESHLLYNQLIPLIQSYKKYYGCNPIIKILSHSHGGNIALNLADCKKPHDELIIDELVLLACPVQHATAHLIQNPLFKKIYAMYSRIDMIQILDPQGLYEQENQQANNPKPSLFSARCFPNQENLSQVKIKVNGRAIMHTEFSSHAFLELLPKVLDEINAWDTQEQGIITPPDTVKRLLCIYTNGRPINRKKKRRQYNTA